MSAIKPVLEIKNDGSLFVTHTFDAKGAEHVEMIQGEKVLDKVEVIRLLKTHVKGATSMRNMRQSMLALVFASSTLDSYKGQGDKLSGKTSIEFKNSVRKAEDAYLASVRGELTGQKLVNGAWVKAGVANTEKEFEAVCGEITTDNNYKNIKSWVSKYFAFCGQQPITSGGFLVPQPYMALAIQAALNIPPPDNSLYAKFLAIKETVDKGTIGEEEARKVLPLARELASILSAIVDNYNEMSTNKVQAMPPNAGDTAKVATEVLGKMRRAPRKELEDAVV